MESAKEHTQGVSVIILTFNEERNIPFALESLAGWAREVFIVDSFSTDETISVALAKRADVKIYQRKFINYSDQWQWAIDNLPLSSPWILKLDADERLTDEFRREFSGLSTKQEIHAISFRRSFFFMGKRLCFGGISNSYDLRMWRRGMVRFENRIVNEHALSTGPVTYMKAKVEHHDYKSVGEWMEKHIRYAAMEVQLRLDGDLVGEVCPRLLGSPTERRMKLKVIAERIPMRYVIYFVIVYIFRMGFLDGVAGFRYAFLRSFYMYLIVLMHKDALRTGVQPVLNWPPRGSAHPAAIQV